MGWGWALNVIIQISNGGTSDHEDFKTPHPHVLDTGGNDLRGRARTGSSLHSGPSGSDGVNFLVFGDALKSINGSDDNVKPIGVFGITLGY